MSTGSDWTEAEIGELTSLWNSGLSTTAIGRSMGRTKNGIVGKAHRIGLPGRPSCIHKQGDTGRYVAPVVLVAPVKTLPPLPSSLLTEVAVLVLPDAPKPRKIAIASAAPTKAPQAPVTPLKRECTVVSIGQTSGPCLWPDGCSDKALAVRPFSYCRTHRKAAFMSDPALFEFDTGMRHSARA